MGSMEEHHIAMTMLAVEPVSRDLLERAAYAAQDALDANASEVALGAAASANFTDASIEIDFIVLAASVAEVHEQVAKVIRVLSAGFDADDATDEVAHQPLSSSPTCEIRRRRFAVSSSSVNAVRDSSTALA